MPENSQSQNPYQPLVIEAGNLAEAWEKAVRAMMTRGYNRFVKAPEYQCWTKDSPMFIMVRDALTEPRLSSKSPITLDMAKALKDAGCCRVSFGLESGDESLRNLLLKKSLSDNQIRYRFPGPFRYQ